jgi:hypothetical protein
LPEQFGCPEKENRVTTERISFAWRFLETRWIFTLAQRDEAWPFPESLLLFISVGKPDQIDLLDGDTACSLENFAFAGRISLLFSKCGLDLIWMWIY